VKTSRPAKFTHPTGPSAGDATGLGKQQPTMLTIVKTIHVQTEKKHGVPKRVSADNSKDRNKGLPCGKHWNTPKEQPIYFTKKQLNTRVYL